MPWRKYDSQRPLFGGDFLGQILAADSLPGAFVHSHVIFLQKNPISAKTFSLGAMCLFDEDPGKICLGAKALQSCLGKVTHPKPIVLGRAASRQEDFGLGQHYKQASTPWACDPGCPVQTPNRASGPKWEKNGRKMDFGPTRKKEKMAEKWAKNGPKMGKKWIFGPIFLFFGYFFPLFPGGAKVHFSAIFFSFRAGGPIWGLYRAIGIATLGLG